jgi:hypothetical protein
VEFRGLSRHGKERNAYYAIRLGRIAVQHLAAIPLAAPGIAVSILVSEDCDRPSRTPRCRYLDINQRVYPII